MTHNQPRVLPGATVKRAKMARQGLGVHGRLSFRWKRDASEFVVLDMLVQTEL